ncbi:hypothetical protein SPRG_22317 [Saprolegnia parasitica CBS 223.65]|uniref:Uncharacterized protein n=1 Tax=Saprolegnia parasitica (strain CBS 223.65) TaxID=695850 RepID=A0A067BXY7_SAPPC|nr:hypothetical protein SPRG_22317 [Saprolegnia parasitica CBS 223.65]KDO21675.1 hypothetical protein SPRG_22317 [Saprolegnia parasitica CBS 223.65]|eukprot:XP_012207632.1 hypothetical protein SPRG_22317 [Saprolegnia parasitica CBS 223.65]
MVLNMADDGVAAAYASALHSLAGTTGAHCVYETLHPRDEVPSLDVDGLESPIAWPLYTDERDELMELFHGDDRACVVVPSAQATFSDDVDEPLLGAITDAVMKRLGIRSAFSAELSHLVLESSGVASTSHLLARNPSESSFGTLLLLAPSIDKHAGGDVTVRGARDAITDVYYFDAMAAWITHALQTYGWMPLQDALQHLLSRAGATWLGAAKGAELLRHLADPRSALHTQPCAREGLLDCWHALLHALVSMPEAPTSVPSALLHHGLVLEAYFGLTAEANATWLGAKLPPSLVRHVDAYRASTLSTLLTKYPTAFHPICCVAVAIDPLLNTDDTAYLQLRPWLRTVFATFPGCLASLNGILDDTVLAAVVRVARAAHALPLVLQHAQAWLGRFILPALLQLLDDAPTLTVLRDPLLTLVTAFLADDVDEDHDHEEMRENPPDVVEMLLRDELAVLQAMLLLLRRLDGPLDMWRRAVATHRQLHDVAFARYVLVPLHQMVRDDDDDLARWLATLARPVLQRHLANDMAPSRPNWVIPSVQLPCDCVQCTAITSFLSDETRSLLSLPHIGLCPLFSAVEKRLPSEGVAIDESPTGSHVVLQKPRHWICYEHALDVAGLAALDATDEDRHAAKRQRRGRCEDLTIEM